ncbi:MAG: DUF996 domain-containing protein [Nitrososphaerota archaeon]|jgi:uncharacterized membrane protein|nr:DUF996 domain-containing protein [Nitrososphaerota archaeon]
MTFESGKTLAGIGSILLCVPIVGLIIMLIGMKDISEHYKDQSIYQHTLTGGIFSVIGIICSYIAFAFLFSWGLGFLFAIVFFIIACVFMLLAVLNLKKAFEAVADRSGENLFRTAGTLLWIGALLTIIGIGLFLMFIGFIIAGIAFLTLKSPSSSQGYNYSPPPTQPNTQTNQTYQAAPVSNIKANFCSNCGASVVLDATFCAHCGKQV